MRIVFYCLAVIGFAASLVEEIKEMKESLSPARSEALSVISAISAGLLLYHATGFSTKEYLLSHGHRLCRFARRRNKGNKGNSLTRPMRSTFCYFCHFCGTLLSHADSIYCPDFYCPAEIKEIAEIIVPDPREVLSALSA